MENKPFVCIIMATMMEAEPFIKVFEFEKMEDQPFSVYNGDDTILIISGIGKANAAMAASYACSRFNPAWILNPGAAGSTDVSWELGSIYQIEKTVEPDRPHLQSNTPYIQIPETLPGFPKAVLATQDKAITTVENFREISSYADLVDMEGASIVQACKKFNKKSILFKFVSDTPEHAGQELILDHIEYYREPFCEVIYNSVIPALKRGAP